MTHYFRAEHDQFKKMEALSWSEPFHLIFCSAFLSKLGATHFVYSDAMAHRLLYMSLRRTWTSFNYWKPICNRKHFQLYLEQLQC